MEMITDCPSVTQSYAQYHWDGEIMPRTSGTHGPQSAVDIGKPQSRPSQGDTRITPGEEQRFVSKRPRNGATACSLQYRNRRRRDLNLVPKFIS